MEETWKYFFEERERREPDSLVRAVTLYLEEWFAPAANTVGNFNSIDFGDRPDGAFG